MFNKKIKNVKNVNFTKKKLLEIIVNCIKRYNNCYIFTNN